MVLSSEIPENRKLNESTFKDITAGDLITARQLYANPFSFKPTHKLWLVGNHKPEIRGVDEGIWRRIFLLKFDHSFPKSGDPGFRERKAVVDELLAEGPGILNWLLKGYADIRANGLNPPDSVRVQTDAYREESDPLAEFIKGHCLEGAGYSCKSHEIWDAYCAYSEGHIRVYHSKRALTDALVQRGFRTKRTSSARMIDGIAPIKPEELI
jgi:putative DNA primase/helicase